MPSPRCLAAVAAASPPFNVLCRPAECAEAQDAIDLFCRRNGYRRDQPYVLRSSAGWCNCCCDCCSGYGKDTAIAVGVGATARVQNIRANDTILAAGLDLRWLPARVAVAGGASIHGLRADMLNVVTRRNEIGAGGVPVARVIQVTEDVLFLLESGGLKPARALAAGDRLRLADGGVEAVTTTQASFFWSGDYQVEMAPFDGVSLDGHLLSANALVTADFAVSQSLRSGQLMREGRLVRSLFHESALSEVAESTREHPPAPDSHGERTVGWSETLQAGPPLAATFTVPDDAKAFLPVDRAADIMANAPSLSPAITFRIDITERLFALARAVCDDVIMLIDWGNPMPNAYAWSQLRQRFVLVTGGLMRVKALDEAGLALVLVQMLAVHAGAECVGTAVDAAVNQGLRRLWPHALFPTMCERGVAQVAALFTFVGAEHAKDDPRNRCERPSLSCLGQTYAAAMAMQRLPECVGRPSPAVR